METSLKLQILLVLAVVGILSACGGGNSQTNMLTGNWTAALSDPNGSPALAFTTSLQQSNGGSTVNVSNLSFTTNQSCFPSGSTATGAFVLSGNFNGQTSGSFQMTVQSDTSTANSNLLTLQGTDHNNVISGTWTLTGVTSGCTGSGNFIMNRM